MCCDLWGMKFNASKTMVVSRSRSIHPQSTQLILDGTVLKKSADLVIFGVTFDAKMNSRCFQNYSYEAWYYEKVLVWSLQRIATVQVAIRRSLL